MSAQNMTIYWPSRDPETNQRKVTYIDGPIDANLSYTYVEDIGFVGLKGDINEDDVINIQDVILIVNMIVNSNPSDSGDLNGDQLVNVLDVILLVNIILGE